MKWIGAILILGSAVWFGFEQSKQLADRSKQLKMVITALQSLEAEIMYGHTPLHEAARKIGHQFAFPVSQLFLSFAETIVSTEVSACEAWRKSLHGIQTSAALKKTEYEILEQFGESLGKHDLFTQQKHILLTLAHLQREEEEARENQKKYEKMYKSLSILAGLLLVLLLF
jgi:stage III sporulation protein AB